MTENENFEFVINNFLTLRLEGEKTRIYVAGQRFQQCSFLLIDIPIEDISSLEEIESIDAAAERLDHSLHPRGEQKQFAYEIPAEVEFWGHCSNLQVWAENGYNSKLLHMNLAFPLLRRLTEVGDPQANKIFKEEIINRYNSGIETVRKYLRSLHYLDYLSVEEFVSLIESEKERDALNQLRELFPKLEEPVVKGSLNPLKLKIDIRNGKLTKIHLGGVGMKEVPVCLTQLSSLEDLNLSYNPLKELPKWIGELKSLRILKITNSGLKELPEEIGLLENLVELNARGNQLEDLPDTIGNLKSLRILELYQNILKSIPKSIGCLSNLKKLDLKENKIKTFPESVGNLKGLEELIASKNLIVSLPDSIGNLVNLKGMYLGENRILSLPDVFRNIENLENISVADNPISQLPVSLFSLFKIRKLYVYGTNIKENYIPKEFFSSRLITIYGPNSYF